MNKLPSKIKCVKCSKECGVRPDVLEARIKLHGSLDKLLSEYFCRGCRKTETYIVNDKPVESKESLSPLMQAIKDGKMWWQQPGYTFLRKGEPAGVGPEMTYKMVDGKMVFVPVTLC